MVSFHFNPGIIAGLPARGHEVGHDPGRSYLGPLVGSLHVVRIRLIRDLEPLGFMKPGFGLTSLRRRPGGVSIHGFISAQPPGFGSSLVSAAR